MFEDFVESLSCDEDVTFTEKVRYNDIDINANAHFLRLVDCNMLNVEGEGTFDDVVTCDDFVCKGKATLKKRLIARNTVVSGNCEVYEKINSDILNVSDYLLVSGKVSSIHIVVSGFLMSNDKVVCDVFEVTGAADIKSKVRTIDFGIQYNGTKSKLVTLNAERVIVKSNVSVPSDFALECDSITCDTCDLSYVSADNVFCETAKIGPGCNIRVLECHDDPVISSGAVVENVIRF